MKEAIAESIRDRKLRKAGNDLFAKLQEKAQVKNIFNDEQLRKSMPGVAASINGYPISTKELAEACIARHGNEVLSALINRKLIEIELGRNQLTVTEADLEAGDRTRRSGCGCDPEGWNAQFSQVVPNDGGPTKRFPVSVLR